MTNISLKEAREILLINQLLLNDNGFKTKKDLLKIIEKLSYVQIDTISVVERAHHHILWTRMNKYRREMLHELMEKDQKIFEYWSHAAAFLPMKNFRYSLFLKRKYKERYRKWMNENSKIIRHVKDRIKTEGSLRSKDFEHSGEKVTGGWWNWKPAKAALEVLFMSGEIMVAKREGFQKTYDFASRVYPEGMELNIPTEEEYTEHLLIEFINSQGFASPKEAVYLRKISRPILNKVIKKLEEEKKIIKIKIDKLSDEYYSTEKKLGDLDHENKYVKAVQILSPFDNIVIQRKRLKNIFGFDYFLECYLPPSKRRFGYFSMPVLIGDEFAGTIDAKADRQKNEFIIRSMHLKNINKKVKNMLNDKIDQLAGFTLNRVS